MFKSQSSIIFKDKVNAPKEIEVFHNDYTASESNNSLTKKKSFDNFTFVNNNSQKKFDKLNNKSKLSKTKSNNEDKYNSSIEHYNEIIESINCSKRESDKLDAYNDQTIKYFNK